MKKAAPYTSSFGRALKAAFPERVDGAPLRPVHPEAQRIIDSRPCSPEFCAYDCADQCAAKGCVREVAKRNPAR